MSLLVKENPQRRLRHTKVCPRGPGAGVVVSGLKAHHVLPDAVITEVIFYFVPALFITLNLFRLLKITFCLIARPCLQQNKELKTQLA